jgi:hypothetical protein
MSKDNELEKVELAHKYKMQREEIRHKHIMIELKFMAKYKITNFTRYKNNKCEDR